MTMLLTVYLARVLGLSFIALGLIFTIRRHYFMTVYPDIVTARMTRLVFATAMVVAGLFLVVAHNIWLTIPAAIISVVGWMILLEGLVYLVLPDETLKLAVSTLNKPATYLVGGAITIAVGIYLTAFGFGAWSRLQG